MKEWLIEKRVLVMKRKRSSMSNSNKIRKIVKELVDIRHKRLLINECVIKTNHKVIIYGKEV